MADQPSSNGNSRLDRMEGLMQILIEDHLKFRDEHLQLLKAQVLLTDHVEKTDQFLDRLAEHVDKMDQRLDRLADKTDKLADKTDKLAESIHELREAQKHTDHRLNALINVVDDIVPKRPNA